MALSAACRGVATDRPPLKMSCPTFCRRDDYSLPHSPQSASPNVYNDSAISGNSVRGWCHAGATAPFKVPQKGSLPKDDEGIKAMIDKSHEMHGQGRSMWFCLSGAGKRGSVGTSIAHADQLDWSAVSQSASSMDSYNLFT